MFIAILIVIILGVALLLLLLGTGTDSACTGECNQGRNCTCGEYK